MLEHYRVSTHAKAYQHHAELNDHFVNHIERFASRVY